jgi:outer membrane protein assembly factor BamE (lipoprotein component of BamABCDE complex)
MSISKKFIFLIFVLFSTLFISCSKDLHFSGISENSINEILQSYQNKSYSKEDVINIIGMPLITEDSQNLWIYRMEKQQGNATFKKTIYNKTLKLRFEDNVLRSVEEVNLN